MARYEMAVDVHEVKADADACLESEERFRELANTLPQVVFERDAGGAITYANDVAYGMFGYAREDLDSGVRLLDNVHESDLPRLAGAVEKMMDGRSTGAVREYFLTRNDGSTFPSRAYTTLIRDRDGNPAGIRGLVTDMTEEKEAERALGEREAGETPGRRAVVLRMSASPVIDDSGEFAGVACSFVDVSEPRRYRRALEAERAFTEKVIDSLKDVFYVVSVEGNGRMVRWN